MDIRKFARIVDKGVRQYGNLIIEYDSKRNVFLCYFKRAYVKDSKTSISVYSLSGRGLSPNEALQDYMKQLEGKYLIFSLTDKKTRYEISVPAKLVLGIK